MDIRKKKILFIIWSYTYGGGAEALLTMIVNHLDPDKYDISIIEYEHADCKIEPVNHYIHVLPPIEKVETPDHQKKGYQVYHTPEVLIDKYIKGDYDLYVSFNYQIPTFLLPKGTKNIAWIHTDVYDLGGEAAARERRMQDIAFDKVQKIVAISDNTERSLFDLFPRHREKVVKIYNALDIENVRKKADQEANVTLKQPSIVFFGRLDANKNPERVLNVLLLIHRKNKNVNLYFVGEGEQRALLEERIQKAGLEESVHLLGYQENPFPIVKDAAVVCQLSHSEGFQMCLLEVLSLGVPIVSTETGAARLLTNHGKCGTIVSADEEAADAVLELLDVDREKIREECRKSAARFALEPYMVRIEKLFDSVIGETEC